jgi:hypothetical protein
MSGGTLLRLATFVSLAFSAVAVVPEGRSATSLPTPGQLLWSADHEEGDLGDWYYPSRERWGQYGGGEYNQGGYSYTSVSVAHSGAWSAAQRVDTSTIRTNYAALVRWAEPDQRRDLFYSAWFYFPNTLAVTPDGYVSLFDFSSSDGLKTVPLWQVVATATASGEMKLVLRQGGASAPTYEQSEATVPVGRWINIRAYYAIGTNSDGQIAVWQDDELLFDKRGVTTAFLSCCNAAGNPWSATWSVTAEPHGLVSSMYKHFVDDLEIRSAQPPPSDAPVTGDLVWRADMEEGNLSDWYYPSTGHFGDYGGGEYNSNSADSSASMTVARSGGWSAVQAIDASLLNPTSGTRLFRWYEPDRHRALYYSVWFYFPFSTTIAGDAYLDVFQFKSLNENGLSTPMWGVLIDNGPNGEMEFAIGEWQGPHYRQHITDIPLGRWVHLQAFYRAAADETGQFIVWQDGVRIFDKSGIRTSYATINGVGNPWSVSWSVNAYGRGLTPVLYTHYVDDAEISLSS